MGQHSASIGSPSSACELDTQLTRNFDQILFYCLQSQQRQDVDLLLAHRLRRWANNNPALIHRLHRVTSGIIEVVSRQIRYIEPMLVECCTTVADGGLALIQHHLVFVILVSQVHHTTVKGPRSIQTDPYQSRAFDEHQICPN